MSNAADELPLKVGTQERSRNDRGNFTRNLNVEDDVVIAKKMFFGGCAFLPWLWAVNCMFYKRYLLDATIDPQVSKWVRRSFTGFILFTVIFVVWVTIFQLEWRNWGLENLLIVVPDNELYPDW